jgi:2-polyprenyl-6-methoxyphenol hydroxylase-like FAD-dependent oxidoreductase
MGNRPVAVLGASFAGCFAAAGLAQGGHEVLLLERDVLPEQPRPRRGVPQGQQPHVLLARGLQEAERLLPGLAQRLRSEGAAPVDTGRLPWLTEWGWLTTGPSIEILSMTRPLLEHVVRDLVLTDSRVTLRDGADVHTLTRHGGAWTVTGTRFPHVRADVVVDATGRSSRQPGWLRTAGLPAPAETVIDARVGYACRLYEGPRGGREGAQIQLSRRTLRGAIALPVEHNRWLIGAVGCGDKRPPREIAGFEAALAALPDPAIADLARSLSPLGDVAVHRQTANRRMRYEELPELPPGLLVVGDALCCFNPIYGQGITVAAIQAAILRDHGDDVVGDRSLRPLLQRLARCTSLPWIVAAGGDAAFPTSSQPPTLAQRLGDAWSRRLLRAAARGDATAADALETAYHLLAPPRTLVRPRAILAGVRGGTGPVPRPEQLPPPQTHPAAGR